MTCGKLTYLLLVKHTVDFHLIFNQEQTLSLGSPLPELIVPLASHAGSCRSES